MLSRDGYAAECRLEMAGMNMLGPLRPGHAVGRDVKTAPLKRQDPAFEGGVLSWVRSLTITYFHTGNPHYHRRGVVSRSCSGWEGVVPTRYGHQALTGCCVAV